MIQIKKLWPWISLVLLFSFTLLVFSFSFDDAGESSDKSEKLTEAIQSVCDSLKIDVEILEGAVRKAAHFLEFFVLGVLALTCSRAFRLGTSSALLYSLITATIDETIQIYSIARSSSTKDVLLDFTGALFGVLCLLLVIKIRKNKKTT